MVLNIDKSLLKIVYLSIHFGNKRITKDKSNEGDTKNTGDKVLFHYISTQCSLSLKIVSAKHVNCLKCYCRNKPKKEV